MNSRKKLPIGVQTFAKIRQNNYYYIDKTALALDLINGGTHYFLSRPRRFGKSLFLDTLKELFEGNQALFTGLAAEQAWDWSVKYPVLHFSFGSDHYNNDESLHHVLNRQLLHHEQQWQIDTPFQDAGSRFAELLIRLHERTTLPVVVLIDEYDKPILDSLLNPEQARLNRDVLRGFYGTIKDYDTHIKFSLLTGVSKFSKVSLFSGLNNLYDLTLDPNYATICGYTDDDIDSVFAPELEGLDRDEIREWYNGYHWLGEGVYNPFDILQLFKRRQFDNYWFETGTPSFLIDLLFQRRIPSLRLDHMLSSSSVLSSFDVDKIATEALLFQTGYLTIKHSQRAGGQTFYTLGYPNKEVYQSLNESLLSALVDSPEQSQNTLRLYELLLQNDFEGLKQLFHSFFASIPYHWYTNNQIQDYEGYYASVFYSYFAALGLKVVVEDCTNLGRIDMTLLFNQQVYLFEFKVVELAPEGKALQQIKDKGYAEKYRARQQPIYLIGVEFSKESRNVVGFVVERLAIVDQPDF